MQKNIAWTWHHSLDEYIYGLLRKLWKCLLPEPFSSSNTFVFFQYGARRNCRTIPTLVRMWRDFRRCFSGGVCGHPFLNWTDLDKHSPVHKKVLLYLNLYIHALYIYISRYRHIHIYIILYIWKSYFRLSQHRFDIYIFWWLSLLHKTLTPMTDAENHHLPVGTFGDRNASSSGKNKKRSFEREDDMGIIANHRAVQGCALQMELFTHVQ